MDDKRLNEYDAVINGIVQDMMGALIHDEYIGLGNFSPEDDEHLLVLHLANVVATAWKRKLYVECDVINWLKLKWRYHHIAWGKKVNWIVNDYLDELREKYDSFPNGFGEIYQMYYTKSDTKGIDE